MSVIDQLKAERERQHLSIGKLADRIGVSAASLGSWERGDRRPVIQQVERWAAALGFRPALTPTDATVIDFADLTEAIDTLNDLRDYSATFADVVAGLRLLHAEQAKGAAQLSYWARHGHTAVPA